MLKRRQAWLDGQFDLDPARLVFIDETGLSTKMARLRGRAPRGERCRAGVPHGHWKTTTFTGALRLTGMTAPFVYDGAMNGNVFLAYVEQVLIPTLSEGDIVVMDNLPAHKAVGVRNAIEAAGASLLSTCRLTVPTSIPLRTPSPSSRRGCAQRPRGRLPHCGTRSARSSTSLPQPNAQTTSKRLDMTQIKQNPL